MIRFSKEKDKEELLKLCISSYAIKEQAFYEYYFNTHFQDGSAIISELDRLLVSQIHKRNHILHLQDKKIKTSFLFGVATHYDYRQRGIMRDLLDMTLDDASKNELITFLDASNPKMFERYGFDVISQRKRYIIYAKELMNYGSEGVSNNYNVADFVDAYKNFTRVFDCYFDRDEAYYEDAIALHKHCGGKVCAYYQEDTMVGYALYFELDDGIEVKEIVYQDKRTLCALLRYAIGYTPFISVEVSEKEHLEKIFRMSVPRTYPALMARINNLKLFNKLYNTNIRSAKELAKICSKPIWLNEKY